MVVIVRDVPGVPVEGAPGRVAEGIPDGRATTILLDGTLDLIRGGGGTQEKVGRKLESRVSVVCTAVDHARKATRRPAARCCHEPRGGLRGPSGSRTRPRR